MRQATWRPCGGPFAVTSYGNGLSYLVREDSGREFFLQGEDASAWRDEFDKADAADKVQTFLADSMMNYGDLT